MLINLRNALMAGKRLPYDAEVEYLQSTNATGYIDTGFAPSDISDCVVDIGFSILTPRVDNNDCYVFGGGPTWGSAIQVGSNSLQEFQCSFGMSIKNGNITWGTRTEVRLDYNGWEINDNGTVRSGTFSGTRSFSSNTIYLFAGHRNDTIGRKSGNKIAVYYFKILRNGVPIQDMIPVRKGTVGYLYDRVTGKLFGNAGTGDFVLGPDVVPVEYIESHGTEWIDTGVVPTSADSFYCRIQQSVVADQCLWGLAGVAYCFSNWDGSSASNGTYWGHPAIGTGGVNRVNPLGDTNWHEILCQPSGIFVDSVQINTQVTDPTQSPLNTVALFARSLNSTGGGVAKNGRGRMSAFRIDRNGDPLHKYLPVRVGTDATSWEGAMMDVLTRRIYRNQGTGAFTYGNDLKYPIPAS